MKLGDRVRLVRFNGSNNAPDGTLDHENYWQLIGQVGEISKADGPSPNGKRVLVAFDADVADTDLECHNENLNALWIAPGDLELEHDE